MNEKYQKGEKTGMDFYSSRHTSSKYMTLLICLAQDTLNCTKKRMTLTRRIDVERGEVKKIPKNRIKKKPKKQK